MGYARFVALRTINLMIVLLIVLIIIIALFEGVLKSVTIYEIKTNVRQEILAEKKQYKMNPPFEEVWSYITEIRDEYSKMYPKAWLDLKSSVYNSVFDETKNETLANYITQLIEKDFDELSEKEKEILRTYLTKGDVPWSVKVAHETTLLIIGMGLHRPWYANIPFYLKKIFFLELRSNFLTSEIWNQGSRNVRDIIAEKIPYSILLFTTSTVIALGIALPLGIFVASRAGKIIDNAVALSAIISSSLPWWWFAMIMIYVFAYQLKILRSPADLPSWSDPLDVLHFMILPVMTIVILTVGTDTYIIRNIVISTLQEDFVTTARAKGLKERDVLLKHVLRAAAPPIVTILMLGIAMSFVSGAIITEVVFNWRGLGRLYYDAIYGKDVPVILGLTYISTFIYLTVRLILDLIYGFLDPRIKAG